MPLSFATQSGLHVAIIMDGNGRWATARGFPRTAGHAAGAEAVRRTVEAARELGGINTLTLFAFSSDNWQRPGVEVRALMRLFRRYLIEEAERCAANGVRITVIGRRDRLSPAILQEIERAEAITRHAGPFRLRLAVDYSARDAILRAAARLPRLGETSREDLTRLLAEDGAATPDVDLLIRTGGEKRLSDFLLWESAYAELVFTERMWPDFGAADLAEALREFRSRERRFGRVPAAAAPLPQAGRERAAAAR
jgi:undecaprenyl diphosphate synthase